MILPSNTESREQNFGPHRPTRPVENDPENISDGDEFRFAEINKPNIDVYISQIRNLA